MKITNLEKISYIHSYDLIYFDEDYRYYRRSGPDDWECLMGECWEPLYSLTEELEEAYQEFIKNDNGN